MTGTLTLLHVAGAVALLLWGTHMVTTGVARGFGAGLRNLLKRGLKNRASACLAGLLVTAILQSSTATALMASSFAAGGFLDLQAGLALMLGANVGTALLVQLLSFEVAAVAPVLILVGFLLFRTRSDQAKPRNLGRAFIGLGLMLTALSLLVHLLATVEAAPVLRSLMEALAGEPILAVLVTALLAWAAHSSVAVVLFIVSLVGAGVVTNEGALALVLGANLGAAVSPYLEAEGSVAARRLPLGNLLVRFAGCIIALPFLRLIATSLGDVGVHEPAQATILFHIALNLALAVLVVPWTASLAALTVRLLPEPATVGSEDDPTAKGIPHHLDEAALPTPSLALANATLEALHMADLASAALRDALQAFRTGDQALAGAAGRRDGAIDRIGLAIRRYLAELGGEETGNVSEDEQARAQEVLVFVLNIEHIGDIIANNLVEFASRRVKRTGEGFSAEELGDIERLHAEALSSLQLALAAFLRDDVEAAREVFRRKALLRRLECAAVDHHFHRLRSLPHAADPAAAAEASALFLRTLRDLRRVHSHVAALASPLLEREDEMPPRNEDEPGSGDEMGRRDGSEEPVRAARSLLPTG